MHKYAHFEHVLHFSGLTYGRHRVQGVKTGGLQPEFAFHQIVSKTPPFITNSTRLFCNRHTRYIQQRRRKILSCMGTAGS